MLTLAFSFLAGTPLTDARKALRVPQEQAAAPDSQCSCWGTTPSRDGWAQQPSWNETVWSASYCMFQTFFHMLSDPLIYVQETVLKCTFEWYNFNIFAFYSSTRLSFQAPCFLSFIHPVSKLSDISQTFLFQLNTNNIFEGYFLQHLHFSYPKFSLSSQLPSLHLISSILGTSLVLPLQQLCWCL